MKKIYREILFAAKSGTNIFLVCFYAAFYFLLFHYGFEIFVSPHSAQVEPEEDHEFLVSEKKGIQSELQFHSQSGLRPGPEDFSLKTTVADMYEFNENLPYSGFRDRPCSFNYLTFSDSCSFKLHTSSWWHWGHRQKSFDIDSLRAISDLQSGRFSLMRPKFLFFPSTVIYSNIAKKYGIYSPEQKIVSFYLNDEFQGPYILKEKTDVAFVAKSIKQPGFIMSHNSKDLVRDYKPAYLSMTLAQYDNTMEANSMLDQNSWSIAGYVGAEFNGELLNELFEKLRHTDKLAEVFDLDYAAKQYALDSIFGIHHRQNSNNNSWFVNSLTHKFYYIPSDSGPFLFTEDYGYVGGMEFTDLLLKNQEFRARVDAYLYYLTVKEDIYTQIKKEVLKYEGQLRLPIENIKLLATSHPISFGAMGSTERLFGTFFHNFTYEDYSNEAFLNLAALLKRKEAIKAYFEERKSFRPEEPKHSEKADFNCRIANSKDFIADIKKNCPKETYEIKEREILFKNMNNFSIENVATGALNRDKIIFSNIQNLRISNYSSTSSSAGFVAIGVKKISMENVEIDDVFGNAISLNQVDEAELKNVRLDRILKIGIECSNVKRFVRDSVIVASAYQDIKIKNCY